jgi:hypothetical protein
MDVITLNTLYVLGSYKARKIQPGGTCRRYSEEESFAMACPGNGKGSICPSSFFLILAAWEGAFLTGMI